MHTLANVITEGYI